MIYIKYMPFHSFRNESRDQRELLAAAEYGFETANFTNDRDDLGGVDCHFWDGTTLMTPKMSKLEKLPKLLRNRLQIVIRTLRLPDGVWSCHDLVSLRLAWLITRLRRKKPLLVYDSHEFEMGRNVSRTPHQWRSVRRWERFLMRRCAFSIMVNDTIADEVQRIHALETRPVVVRSTPSLWTLEAETVRSMRGELLKAFSKCEDGKEPNNR